MPNPAHVAASGGPFRGGVKAIALLLAAGAAVFCAPGPGTAFADGEAAVAPVEAHGAAHAGAAEEHLSPQAMEIVRLAGIPVTNSMITSGLAFLVLTAAAVRFNRLVLAGRRTLFTGVVESLVIFLYGFLADIMGEQLARKTFWLLASFFIFILCSNWLGLFPGVGSIGWGHATEHMFKVTLPLFRGVNADLNTTLALGGLFFLFWFIWAWQENGPVGILRHIFAPKGDLKGIMYFAMAAVFLAVGFLEIFSMLIRPFSLALRLYGNIYAGEVMLETMLHKVPALGWLLPIPFYLMEVLVGMIQALVFTLLSAVFVMLICSHEGTEEHSEHGTAPDAQKH